MEEAEDEINVISKVRGTLPRVDSQASFHIRRKVVFSHQPESTPVQ